jgi:hypothetical protein
MGQSPPTPLFSLPIESGVAGSKQGQALSLRLRFLGRPNNHLVQESRALGLRKLARDGNALLVHPDEQTPLHLVLGASASITLIVFSLQAFVVSQSNWPERKETEMKATCINQIQLAARWGISHRTLERWRWTGVGPKFLKVGGRVVYRLSDVQEYEQSIVRSSTSDLG